MWASDQGLQCVLTAIFVLKNYTQTPLIAIELFQYTRVEKSTRLQWVKDAKVEF